VKLIEKVRAGSKVTRGYNKPKTPCRRIIKSNKIFWKIKEKFTEQCNSLTLAELKRVISISCKKEIIQAYNLINITPMIITMLMVC
jgi:DNA polymerase III delta subunit